MITSINSCIVIDITIIILIFSLNYNVAMPEGNDVSSLLPYSYSSIASREFWSTNRPFPLKAKFYFFFFLFIRNCRRIDVTFDSRLWSRLSLGCLRMSRSRARQYNLRKGKSFIIIIFHTYISCSLYFFDLLGKKLRWL